ncbi:FtsK/SpoIIIE domain-containing protein [Solwaraspora sp. WMMD791]|uniref:FtsK/SpoIIIE domain-containing protein n=1 Tax=Solwaraspora sp. WMMD791 TaxID=3016086 RepID=UPI00249A1763|nr:FtsK/SpoIIIE domain-containing protein [Solwaraspora sp. WMMD791]WFE29644.1 FtsK/SpoIIIE domain-containing protein [Solwaraspora sp. WMMD791]
MTTTPIPAAGNPLVPVGPSLSMFDPIYLGIDEFGEPVYLNMVYRNLLAGGEPGGGKSGLLNTVCAHAALSTDTRLVLFDGKLVELGMWEDVADEFIGPDIDRALTVLRRLQVVMNNRYAWLRAHGRRKVTRADKLSIITVICDEIAFYSATIGSKPEQEEFVTLLRDLVARGRAAGIPVVAATQRPSFDIIPTSLRDLFGYRAAFRCTTPNSSNIVLGHGWAEQGYSATDISPTNQGAAYLLAEGGMPRRIKVAYLSDQQIQAIADYAAWIRRPTSLDTVNQRYAPLDWGMAA